MQARLNRYDLMFPVAISYYNVFVNFMLYFASQVSRPHFRHLYRAPIFVGTALQLLIVRYRKFITYFF